MRVIKYKPMSQKDYLASHPKPVNRRQFMSLGLTSGAGYLMMPSLLDMLIRPKIAQAAPGEYIPFMVFDGAGGFGIPSIFMAGGEGGPTATPLSSYAGLGFNTQLISTALPNNAAPIQQASFLMGVPGVATSKGLLPVLQANNVNLNALQFMTVAHAGADDTAGNSNSALQAISKIYASQAQYITTGLGQSGSTSGGRTGVANPSPALTPLNVASVDAILGSVGLSGALTTLAKPQQVAWANLVNSLTQSEAGMVSQISQGQTMAELAAAGTQKNVGFVNGVGNTVDPRLQPSAQTIYGITAATAPAARQSVNAAIAWNVLNGFSGPGVIQFAGCDYHGRGIANKNAKDAEIGQAIGEAIAMASVLGKKFMFQIITDGGVNMTGTDVNTTPTGDGGAKSMTVIGLFDPAVKDHYMAGKNAQNTQVGAYVMAGSGAAASIVSGGGTAGPAIAATVVANYLNVLGRLGEFNKFTPIAGLDATKLLVFG